MNESMFTTILPDIPRIYTALSEWLACLLCIVMLKKRVNGWKLVLIAATALVIQSVFLIVTKNAGGIWWMVCMAIAVALMVLFVYSCCEVTLTRAGYSCARAFLTAEFAASLEWQLYCYIRSVTGYDGIVLRGAMLVMTYGIVYLITWKINRHLRKPDENVDVTRKELWTAAGIAVAVFALSNLGFTVSNTPFSGRYSMEIFNIRTMVDLGGLAILYAYHIQWNELRVRQELESIQSILRNQFMQYEQSQKTLDLINYRYHDLKHHIIALRAEESRERRNQYLDRMEEEIRNYEAQNKTGNKVLDTMLTSKSLDCQQSDITFTCVVDGHLFDFMDALDICSIFGNALDNAIECEKQIKDPEKRLIHVSAFSQKSFLIIGFENYYEGTLVFDENLPVTTKKEERLHGYGLKSLRYTVHKYKGEVDINVSDNWFALKILIPL